MKHTPKIIILLTLFFFISQIIGLVVINQYIDHKTLREKGSVEFTSLPYDVERPPIEESDSVWYIISAILLGTAILLLIIKFKGVRLWKFWYFTSVFITLGIAFYSFLNYINIANVATFAFIFAAIAGYFKIFKPTVWVHNLTEVFIYGGLAAIFVPIMNLFSAIILLFLISVYDMYAVWKSKHMVKLAEFTSQSKVFAGLSFPYNKSTGKIKPKKIKTKKVSKKVKNAILGGGDIGFPLLFSGVVMKELMINNSIFIGFTKALIIPIFTTLALYILFMKGEQNKFYPAMPFLSLGCFIGYGFLKFIELF